jgi:plastocyanin
LALSLEITPGQIRPMMTWGAGSAGWVWMLAGLALVIGIVLVIVWALQRTGGGAEDDALTALRGRFARGEIDAGQFEEMRRVLGSTERQRGGDRVGLIGLLLIVGAVVVWIVAGATGLGGPNWGWNGMMGPGGMLGPMMGLGAGPTAPAGTSVRLAGTRFGPSTLTIRVGETVRWFNDDALPHTVSASDGSWDSGNLAPGQSFEKRFDTAGTYPYLCRYHPGMIGTIEVTTG